ncbi:MAG: Neopullulanase 2 [Phycisphaerae bacterium]|nr:Neopullulanase 2 [Phycisphaerae bacterium]
MKYEIRMNSRLSEYSLLLILRSWTFLLLISPTASAQEGSPPQWSREAVWYQIFPTRFRNGDPTNDPPNVVPWNHAWDEPLPGEKPPLSPFQAKRCYGGDLEGIRQRLPYLQELGITAIYLNPVFQALTEHKYDTCDYRHIDDTLGVMDSRSRLSGEIIDNPATWQWSDSDKLFLQLLNEAHALGIHVVIDGVFNHVGPEFEPWVDVRQYGRDSRFARWFSILDWGPPLRWQSWFGENGNLIFVRKTVDGVDPAYRDFIFAVVQRWMDPNGDGDPSDGVDGWRLDAPQFVPHGFWRELRTHIKKLNSQAVIVGELWTDPSLWIDAGDQWDASTNYALAYRVLQYFAPAESNEPLWRFWSENIALLQRFGPATNEAMWNLLDSHDTDRLASMMVNPARGYNQDNNPDYLPNGKIYLTRRPAPEEYERVKLALAFQFCWVGAPLIYYGTEVGMYGGHDPHCRKPMLWEDQPANLDPQERIEPSLRPFLQRLAWIRRQYPVLIHSPATLRLCDEQRRVLIFERADENQRIWIILNLGAHPCDIKLETPNGGHGAVDLLDLSNDVSEIPATVTLSASVTDSGKAKLPFSLLYLDNPLQLAARQARILLLMK